jgi:glycerophosphoryl diester phosphodiesterase
MLSSLLIALTAVHCLSQRTESPRALGFFDGEQVLVVAHRGGTRLGPEHTLWTFERALAVGVDVIEIDVRQAGDGELVVIHDDTVDRTTDRRGAVAALPRRELGALDAAYRWSPDGGVTFPLRGRGLGIPTVEEVLASFPRTRFVLEIKSMDAEATETLCETIRRHAMTGHVLIAAFRSTPLRGFREACPEVATAATVREVQRVWFLQRLLLPPLYRPPADAFLVPERWGGLRVLDAAFVRRARTHSMSVGVWTVNEPDDVTRLLAIGVRAFVTDDPERILAALGRPPPLPER